jgi:hypothetical protein
MKKIGVLYGTESGFPSVLCEKINELRDNSVTAEFLQIDKVIMGRPLGFDVIIDRISHDVPFYRSFLKNEAFAGTAVLNNPIWSSSDDKFLQIAIMQKLGLALPKTVILPSKEHPDRTESNSFKNMKYPLNWDGIFSYVGFPAFIKPHSGGGQNLVKRLENIEQFFRAYDESGQSVMMLQENIEYSEFFRGYSVDRKDVCITSFDPLRQQPAELVYENSGKGKPLFEKMKTDMLAISKMLGYDFHSTDFAVKNGIPFLIDISNPFPSLAPELIGSTAFSWLIDKIANMVVKRAKSVKANGNNCTWGEYLKERLN